MKAGVIGSGIGGLATAIRLAKLGYKVKIFEKNSYAGGKLSEINTASGYRFDTGPSLLTLPNLINELFENLPQDAPKVPKIIQLDNNCRYFFRPNHFFDFFHNEDCLKKEVELKTKESFENIKNRLSISKEMYELAAPMFLFHSLHKKETFLAEEHRSLLFKMHKLNFLKTMHTANKNDFADEDIIKIFDRYATYNGSNPYKAPATLNMIAHLENNIGAFLPEKGMYQIIKSLVELAHYLGVEFLYDTTIDQIVVEDKKAVALNYKDKTEPFDVIISDADAKFVSRHLIRHPLKKRLEKQESSTSAVIFYWGIKTKRKDLDVHNIMFAEDYNKEFDSLFKAKELYHDPTVYIYVSSKLNPNDAPEGCENWFVMVNAPSVGDVIDKERITVIKKQIIDKINRFLQMDVEPLIDFEEIATPGTIEDITNSQGGALYGPSSNSVFSAFLRHPNFIKKIANLYFVGGSVHPGGGIPLCLASAQIVANEINGKKNN